MAVQITALVTGGPGDPVTSAEEDRIAAALTLVSPGVAVSVERGWADDLATPRAVLAGPGAALVLIATFTETGLAHADARPDCATLAAVGVAPRARRRMAMGSAAVVGGSGAVLGVLVGLAPGIAVSLPLTTDGYVNGVAEHVLDIPWALLGAVGLAVPLLAMAVTGLAVRSRLPMERRRG